MCVYPPFSFSIHLPAYMSCLHISAIVNKAAINMGVQTVLWVSYLNYSVYISISGIARSCVSSIFLRNFHIVFHSCGTILHSHQQSTKVAISPQFCQHLLLLFSTIAILQGVRCYFYLCFLICVLLIMMLCIFSYTCRPFASLPWKMSRVFFLFDMFFPFYWVVVVPIYAEN